MDLAKVSVAVVQEFSDGDVITATYDMPVILDSTNSDRACEIIAYHLNAMSLELKGVDRAVHTMQ